MSTRQPEWKLIAQLGDVNPIDYGGYFVYIDTTGVYAPEAEKLFVPEDDDGDDTDAQYEVRRFILEPCTFLNGILSDNKYHPDHAAWFAKPENLRALASFTYNDDIEKLVSDFCSDNITDRAWAWQAVGDYFGYDNLDESPLFLTRKEAIIRYKKDRMTRINGHQ